MHILLKSSIPGSFEIADRLKVEYIIGPMGNYSGCYLYLKRHRCIFLNNELSDQDMRLVMAHELGHAILHRKENCYFIRNKTFLSTVKIEREANTFAAELLIPDSLILENPGYTKSQLARLAGYDEMIMELRRFIKPLRRFNKIHFKEEMIMKKKLVTLMLAGIMAFSMAACGESNSSQEMQADATTEEGSGVRKPRK